MRAQRGTICRLTNTAYDTVVVWAIERSEPDGFGLSRTVENGVIALILGTYHGRGDGVRVVVEGREQWVYTGDLTSL